MTIEAICKRFAIEGEIVDCDVIKSGNINDTYKVTFRKDGEDTAYIVQQINTYVFKNPTEMMKNISRVTSHISSKLTSGKDRKVLNFLTDKNGKSCFFDGEKCWRAYKFIDNSVTYDTCEDLEVLEQAGYAFGRFQRTLGDFDASTLFETIPHFHDTEKRMQTLFSHAEEDAFGRAGSVEKEVSFFKENYDRAVKLTRMQKAGDIPLRVTHNDTKCNNVLFDKDTKKALAVIDLDTVMPGIALYDYGDAVRFSANTAEEDEADTSKVALDTNKFRAFTKGFLAAAGEVLTNLEKENLVDSIIAIGMELASRFLDDYITGDKYFKVDYPGHNLVRTRSQIALVRDVMKKYDELCAIVKEMI